MRVGKKSKQASEHKKKTILFPKIEIKRDEITILNGYGQPNGHRELGQLFAQFCHCTSFVVD